MTYCKMQTARELSKALQIIRITPKAIRVTVRKQFSEYLMTELGRVKYGLNHISNTN